MKDPNDFNPPILISENPKVYGAVRKTLQAIMDGDYPLDPDAHYVETIADLSDPRKPKPQRPRA